MTRPSTDVDLFGATVLAPALRRAGIGSHQASSSITDEWITPRGILAKLGPFDLDPCSPGDRRPWDTARTHLAVEDDGLTAPWAGRVWLNPPYSQAGHWLRRLALHGRGTALIFARTETAAWFDHVWPYATALLFIRGRLTFHHVDGRLSGFNAGAPSVLVAYGRDDARRLQACRIPGRFVPLIDLDRAAAYTRHHLQEKAMSHTPPEPTTDNDEQITDAWAVSESANELGVDAFSAHDEQDQTP